MKSNFIHICFVIDESGSMSSSVNDVIGGFNKLIKEQKEEKNGTCAVSLFKFNGNVTEVYRGKDVKDVKELKEGKSVSWFHPFNNGNFSTVFNAGTTINESENDNDDECTYSPGGCTAMNDGIGTAIDKIGQWLAAMPEEERPEKNLIVIMTDGEENSSHEYTLAKVKEMIKHQEEKYSWSFMYMGTDIRDTKDADDLGIKMRAYNTRDNIGNTYACLTKSLSSYRNYDSHLDADVKSMAFSEELTNMAADLNNEYEKETGLKMA